MQVGETSSALEAERLHQRGDVPSIAGHICDGAAIHVECLAVHDDVAVVDEVNQSVSCVLVTDAPLFGGIDPCQPDVLTGVRLERVSIKHEVDALNGNGGENSQGVIPSARLRRPIQFSRRAAMNTTKPHPRECGLTFESAQPILELAKLSEGPHWLAKPVGAFRVSVEPFHLFRYLDEETFRFNTREQTDGERMTSVIGQVSGRRLTYNDLTGSVGAS